MSSNIIKLQSSEGSILEVSQDVIKQSKLIKSLLADCDGPPNEAIPLPNVNGPILARVIEFCKHYQNDPQRLAMNSSLSNNKSFEFNEEYDDINVQRTIENVTEWDHEFFKVDQGTLFDLILAANYLGIPPLLDLACYSVANMMKGKSVEEIRSTFNIKSDFTPEEEEMVIRDNSWCKDL
ncbi:hypothetical protein H4219_000071 [Mycoemilia scoparia]|uniref:E3 ubiquitin ligase complex SCF subunit n=1 Tax=Mycoemilia scoparia TaxID=417184 RepID=A0A9W8DRX1_9FUNG|nr:hypothetical protein H4219_000071 [Mycoemilia scoparia]